MAQQLDAEQLDADCGEWPSASMPRAPSAHQAGRAPRASPLKRMNFFSRSMFVSFSSGVLSNVCVASGVLLREQSVQVVALRRSYSPASR